MDGAEVQIICGVWGAGRDLFSASLVRKGLAETVHKTDAFGGDFAGFRGAQGLCDGEELGLEVIKRVGGFVKRAVGGHRVRGMKQSAAQLARYSKAAGDADSAKRVEPVGVLEHLCFEGFRPDFDRKAVGVDRVMHLWDQRVGVAGGFQEFDGIIGR